MRQWKQMTPSHTNGSVRTCLWFQCFQRFTNKLQKPSDRYRRTTVTIHLDMFYFRLQFYSLIHVVSCSINIGVSDWDWPWPCECIHHVSLPTNWGQEPAWPGWYCSGKKAFNVNIDSWHHEIFNKDFLFVLHVMVSLYSLQLFYFLIRT